MDLNSFFNLFIVITYVLYMCMFPACCLRQKTYVTQDLVNRVLNETLTHTNIFYKYIYMCVYFQLVAFVRKHIGSSMRYELTQAYYIYMCVCVCMCVFQLILLRSFFLSLFLVKWANLLDWDIVMREFELYSLHYAYIRTYTGGTVW